MYLCLCLCVCVCGAGVPFVHRSPQVVQIKFVVFSTFTVCPEKVRSRGEGRRQEGAAAAAAAVQLSRKAGTPVAATR